MTKISDLPSIDPDDVDAEADLTEMVDMSEVGVARNKKLTIKDLAKAVGGQLHMTWDGKITVEP